MKLQGVGGRRSAAETLLSHDWFQQLEPPQLEAYIRYLFIYFREGVKDWDSPAHSRPRPHWDGGKDTKGVRHKNIWKLIAASIDKCGANPSIWVAAHFSPSCGAVRIAQGKSLIATRPELLNSNFSLEIYDEHIRNFDDSFLQRFHSAEASLDTRFKILKSVSLSPDDRALLTLCDKTHVNATPFLRHAFSSQMCCRRAVKRFAVQAALDYEIEQPLYDEFIASHEEFDWLLTDELKNVVIWFRQHWRNYRG
jgi:hypothetical protein